MASPHNISTANDNAPARLMPSRHLQNSEQVSATSNPDKQPSLPTSLHISNLTQSDHLSDEHDLTKSLKLTLGCWAGAILLIIASFGLGFGTGPKVFASIALLWTGLWSSYITADHGRWRLSEISVVTALIGLMGATTVTANYFGLGLTLADGLMLMSIFPIIIGYLLKSRICILASICASLIWGALSFAGLVETSNLILAFPLICAAQIYTGTKIRSGMAITLAVITGYYWISNIILTAWSADNLPLTFAATALFCIGFAHHRSGKAAEDKRLTGSAVHIYAGWIAAMIGAIGFQYFWLSPDAIENSTATLSARGLAGWKALIATSLAVIFCSAIIRYKHTQISLAGIFILTAVSAIIPMMLWFPSWPQTIASAIPGLSAVPTIGILMGAAITAAALGMALNGVRRHSSIMMSMGIITLFVQAYLLVKPEFITLDNSIIFISGFLTALATSAVIAGTSLSHQAPAPRLKHA